jgi:hypothetical protein
MGLTRRDFFTLGLGAAVAVPLTPMPWKLIDDSAKWSQNWSWIPRPPSGPRTVRKTICTLCPAGCGMDVRCVGQNLVGISPTAGHPVSRGVLCPYAFGAHQLPFHPARLLTTLRKGTPVPLEQAQAEIAARIRRGVFGIVDERPGRAVSAAYQRLVAARGGLYGTAPRAESSTLARIAAGSGLDVSDLGLALENVRTLVSFGAPVLESWATPGRVLTLWREKRLDIVQVEPEMSKTAALASVWVQNRANAQSAIDAAKSRGPILAISDGSLPDSEEQAIADLNRRSSGIVRRPATRVIPSTCLAAVPNGSLDVLFVDHGPLGGSVAYDALRSKLRDGGILVSLSPYRAGVAALADYVIPAPAFTECIDEAPTPWDAVKPSYSVAPALSAPPIGTVHPLSFVASALGTTASPEAIIRARVDELFASKSSEEMWKAMLCGHCWIDDKGTTPVEWQPAHVPQAWHSRRPAIAPPLLGKA